MQRGHHFVPGHLGYDGSCGNALGKRIPLDYRPLGNLQLSDFSLPSIKRKSGWMESFSTALRMAIRLAFRMLNRSISPGVTIPIEQALALGSISAERAIRSIAESFLESFIPGIATSGGKNYCRRHYWPGQRAAPHFIHSGYQVKTLAPELFF